MGSFLKFIVKETFEGRAGQLKESVIGTEVYGREPGYDSRNDPTVRVEAGKLRTRLREYYSGPGKADLVVIDLPKGSYVAVLSRHQDLTGTHRKAFALAMVVVALTAIGVAVWRTSLPRSPSASVAVLPFLNLSSDPENEYFSNGITEAIIDELANVGALHVISQTSSFALKGKQLRAREIGDLLKVDMIVEGGIRKESDRLKITVQLIRVRDDRHLWSHTYDREIKDVFATQDEIAHSIVETLQVKLPNEVSPSSPKRYTQNVEVYNLYLKGRYFWDKFEPSKVEKALTYFQQAIAKAPDYAPAYAGIAHCYQRLVTLGKLPPQEGQAKTKAAAEKALQLDPTLAEAHAILGVWSTMQYDWTEAERRFRRAIALNPNFALAHRWYGNPLLAVIGRPDEALRELQRAEELDPLSADGTALVAQQFRNTGRPDEAIAQARKALELDPTSLRARGYLAIAYVDKGMFTEGLAEMEKLNVSTAMSSFLAWAYATSGQRAEAVRILDQLLDQSRKTYVPPGNIARAYAVLGDSERAFEWLDKGYELHDGNILNVVRAPEFAGLRAHPRYAAFRRKLNLPN